MTQVIDIQTILSEITILDKDLQDRKLHVGKDSLVLKVLRDMKGKHYKNLKPSAGWTFPKSPSVKKEHDILSNEENKRFEIDIPTEFRQLFQPYEKLLCEDSSFFSN